MKIDRHLVRVRYYAPSGYSERMVEVLEPAEARDIIRRNAKETLQLYEED